MNPPQIFVFENTFALNNFLLQRWVEIAKESLNVSGIFNVALSGGKTPIEFYTRLCSVNEFDLWRKTHLFFTDERFVPFNHPDNTAAMVKRTLTDYVNIPKDNIHPIRTDVDNVALATEEYKNVLQRFFRLRPGDLPVFDIVLLGIGEDGHTASLFPGQRGIDDPKRLTMPTAVDYLPHERVSMSLSVINNARHKIFIATGDSKAEIMKKILIDHSDTPASKVHAQNGPVIFLLDKKAAKHLPFHEDTLTHRGQAIQLNLSSME